MITDRELLELAARAAGYAVDWREWVRSHVAEFATVKHVKCAGFWLDGEEWNPLTDDGDALRLAVYLEFEIDITSTGVAVRTRCGLKVLVNKTEEPDLCAAARLAITRAAAEIGRQMEVTT